MPMSPTASHPSRESGVPVEGMRLRPILAAAIAVAVVLVAFALPPAARASTGTLAPPHGDAGLDTDVPADGLFDYLVISVHVDVTAAGGFIFIVQLWDGTGTTSITQAQKLVDLQAGPSSVDVRVDGRAIRQSGFDGPYQARIVMLNDTFSMMGVNVYMTTGAYLATSFDPVAAALAPPHADVGVDTDGDLRFEYLALDVFLNVTDPGPYMVRGELWDASATAFISQASNTTYLSAGSRLAVRLRFSGTDIRVAGLNGPYHVDLTLVSASGARIDGGAHDTGAYFLSDFVPAGISFAPPHEDYVVDLDGDGFHDYLVLNAEVSVRDPGFYRVHADIAAVPLSVERRAYLPAGAQVVQLDFLGVDLFTSGIDGPYNVDLTVTDDGGRTLDLDAHTTARYFAVDFEPSPPARWVPPTADSVRDDDGNGLWDDLVVNATVDAVRRGTYDGSMDVWDATFTTYIGSASGNWELSTGRSPVEMQVPGLQIATSGVDGPYGIELYLYDNDGRQVDTMTLTTGAHLATDFEGIPARLTRPYVDVGVDRSTPPDGIFDVLAVDVPVTVTRAGTFLVNGGLLDASFSVAAFDQTFADLSPGLTTVRLNFPGTDLFRSGQEGAFFGFLSLSVLLNTDVIPLGNDNFVTRNYTAAQFDRGAGLRLSGVARAAGTGEPLEATDVLIWSSTTRLQRQVTTDASGYYATWLPRGDYLVVADSASRNAAGSAVTLAADTTLDFPLDLPPLDAFTGNITFSGWDNASVRMDFTMGADAVLTRLRVDVSFGNGDGVASQSEIDRVLLLGGAPELPISTRDMFTLDGVPYSRVNGTAALSIGGTGPVISPAPIVGTLSGNFTASTPISATPLHRSRFLSTYDTFDHVETFSLNWPSTYVMRAFDPAPAVAVGGIGTPTTVVDPAADPDLRDFVRDVWLNLTIGTSDSAPPLVTGAALDGQATLRTRRGPTAAVTASATDAGRGDWAIGGANFTIGPRNWASSTAMVAQDGAFDSPTEAISGTLATASMADGTYLVCAYARDIVPNNDTTGSCATLVVDSVPPSLANARVDGATTKTVVVGTSVTLTAAATDAASGNSVVAAANFTRGAANWPGTAMATADGAFDEPAEDLTATVSTTGWTAGTYSLCVYARDDVGNSNLTSQACAQLVVLDQDIDRPLISDARASPNPANVSATVNISATVTDNVGVDAVYIEVFDPAGTSVANLTASYDTATGRYYATRAFAAGGAYTYRISARDPSGNWRTATGAFTVSTGPLGGPSLADLWWLFLLVGAVAAVAVIAFIVWSRRKRGGAATAPGPEGASPATPPPPAPPAPPALEAPPPESDAGGTPPPPPP